MQIEYSKITDKTKIIDIRSSLDFASDGIPNSINVPRLILLSNPDLYMNKRDSYYLICDKGTISLSCVKILNALGFNCYSIIGGIDGIKKIGFNKK